MYYCVTFHATSVLKSALFQAGLSIHDCLALIFQTCPGKCAELQPCVQCLQFQSGKLMDKEDEYGVNLCDKCPFDVIEVSRL